MWKVALRETESGYRGLKVSPTQFLNVGNKKIVYWTEGSYVIVAGFAVSGEYVSEGSRLIDVEYVEKEGEENVLSHLQKLDGFPQNRNRYGFCGNSPHSFSKC